jgi:hypothetical protein
MWEPQPLATLRASTACTGKLYYIIGTREEGRNTVCTWNEAQIELMRGRSLPGKGMEDRERWKLVVRNPSRLQHSEKEETVPNESYKE